MGFEITLDIHGPVFDGRAYAAVHDYISKVVDMTAERGSAEIKAYLPTQYMYLGNNGGDPYHNPVPANAGELVAAIHSDKVTFNRAIITDDPVTYGDWIEGVSALNMVVWPGRIRRGLSGRFPGYFAFRKTAQALRVEMVNIATTELPGFIAEMNA